MQQQWRGIVFTFRYIPLLLYRAYIDLHEDESQKHDGRKKSSEHLCLGNNQARDAFLPLGIY